MKRQAKFVAMCLAVFLLIVTPINLVAAASSKPKSLNETMVSIGHTMEELFPILFSKRELNQKQQKQLIESVEKLASLFEGVKTHLDSKSPTYGISFDVVKAQLSQAKSANKYKNYNYTRSILKDLTTVCTSCHTQDSKLRTLFPNIKRRVFESDYQFAEFSYMTRNYDTAIEFLKKHLGSKKDIEEGELLSIMKQMMTIYIQIFYQPDKAIQLLTDLKDNPHHTKFSRKTLEEWLAGIKDLKKERSSLKTITNMDQLNLEVNRILGDLHEPGSAQFPNKRERITRLWLRGALYHYLNTNPSREEIPVVLYWLAIVDRSINFSIYYSLADMYLKECVIQYTSHPYARKCYEEYKENMILSYSGSRGTDIPDDIQDDLNNLKVLIEGVAK